MTPEAVALSVLVVDDHRMFADALAQRLSAENGIGEVSVAGSLGEAEAITRRSDPDVVLLDLDLAGEWGPDLITRLTRLRPRHVLVVSAAREPEQIARALSAGADGYIEKGTGIDRLLEAISSALRGEMYLPPPLVRPLMNRLLEQRTGPPAAPTFLDDLTPREREVLRCLVAGATRREVAATLQISVATVRTHVQHLLNRAGVHSTLALVSAARAAGIDEAGSAPGSP